MTCAFQAAFSRWTVGFGIEGQWNALRAAVGLDRLPGLQEKAHNLDYALLVKPHVVAATLTGAHAVLVSIVYCGIKPAQGLATSEQSCA